MSKKAHGVTNVRGGDLIKMDVRGQFDVITDMNDGYVTFRSIMLESGRIIKGLILDSDLAALVNSKGGSLGFPQIHGHIVKPV
ncbi:hypothetical protein [Methylophaga sp.]|uniref:hypothetical protein n=1 Tax=Methylophaga sp. TaxID=2024840 RepID=UPI00271C3464|nr:hypothetical protein [Methylophaga sp.]MDO8825988.1 hypothetical protein [Methylophaga sp.]